MPLLDEPDVFCSLTWGLLVTDSRLLGAGATRVCAVGLVEDVERFELVELLEGDTRDERLAATVVPLLVGETRVDGFVPALRPPGTGLSGFSGLTLP